MVEVLSVRMEAESWRKETLFMGLAGGVRLPDNRGVDCESRLLLSGVAVTRNSAPQAVSKAVRH